MAAAPLFTVAYPDLDAGARARVQALRERHDPQAALIDAHFTLIFGVRDLPQTDYLAHVAAVAQTTAPIYFCCNHVQPWAGPVDADVHLFLVPDEGREAITALHDRLYGGPLARYLRTDLSFLPHITVGRAADLTRAQALSDEVNAQAQPFSGRLKALTVGALRPQGFEPLARLPFGA